jgi:hypothetical protein
VTRVERGGNRVPFEGFVHPFVRAVLLGLGGEDALVLNPQTQPPHVELRQAVDPSRGEGHAVVGADGAGQAILSEQSVEDGAHAVAFRGEQAVAGEEVAGVLVGDGERVAIDAVAGPEVPLEVRGPEIVRLRRDRRDHAGVLRVAPAPAFLDEAAAGQEIAGGADGGPVQGRLPRSQPGQELGGAPARMLAARRADHRRDGRGDAVRALMGRAAAIAQPLASVLLEAVEPLVAGLAADAVPRAKLDHRIEIQPVILDEALSLVHG